MKYKHLVLTTCLFFSSNAHGITLHQALTAAYNNSDQLKAAQETFKSNIEAMPQALAGFLPDVSASVGKNDQKITSTSALNPTSPQRTETTQRNITMSQNLFNGGSNVAAVKAAQSSYRASRAQLYNAEQKVLTDALAAYMDVYATQEKYNISVTSLAFYQKQKESVDEKMKVGEATLTDVAQANVGVASAEAGKAVAFANLESAKALFIKTFGTEPVEISLPDVPTGLPDTMDELIAKTESANFTVQQAKHNAISTKAAATSKKGGLLPKANFQASLGNTYYGREVAPSFTSSGQTNSRTFSTGVSVTIPIFAEGGAQYSIIRQANNAARGAAHQLADNLTTAKAQAIGSFAGYAASKSAAAFRDEAVSANTLALEGVQHEYDVGSKTILDVLNAQEALNQSQTQSIDSKVAYVTAAYAMKASIGEMTAVALKLPVKYFNPGTELRKVKGIVWF